MQILIDETKNIRLDCFKMALNVTVPIDTEVLELNQDSKIKGGYEQGSIVITIDTTKQNVHERLGLGTKTKLHWDKRNDFEAQELSSFLWPIKYRIITRCGFYYDENGEVIHFTTKAYGIDARRHVSEVLMRAAILLLVVGGIGYRQVSFLMKALFHVKISKSSLHRWTQEIAEKLPSFQQMVELLNQKKPITEGHLDELFPLGTNHCLLVLKDEHGRILAANPVKKRDEESTKKFLQKFKDLDLDFKAFYTDGYKPYYNAIKSVFGNAMPIQLDYFHVIQNIWKKLRKWTLDYRRDVKKRAENCKTPWYKKKLESLAESLWKNRYLLFKATHRMTDDEKKTLEEMLTADEKVGKLRSFLGGVWNIFEDSDDENEALKALAELKSKEIDKKDPKPFKKSIAFLEKNFHWMTEFLRCDNVKRNSLAETGMRVLRRLEFAHDGFRSDVGRENFLRIYQAIKYLDWEVYRPPPELMDS